MSLSIDDLDTEILSCGLSNVSLSAVSSKVFAQRATVELVLDPRTRMMVFKMINRGLFDELQGCISAGKEANVYCAHRQHDNAFFAVKIYKTSILIFKDRERYIVGEFRFRRGYNKSNPRKMVQLWAEKELRNLKRPSPTLKNIVIESAEEGTRLYIDLIMIVRTLFQVCKLVHADLSEYNILYHQEELWIIDVSQAVEHDHPHALEFLRKDCFNINSYFKKYLPSVLSLRTIFDFVVSPKPLEKAQQQEHLLDLLSTTSQSCTSSYQDEIDERVFFEAYIPRTLSEVIDIERDTDKLACGDTKELLYSSVSGIAQRNSNDDEHQVALDLSEVSSSDTESPEHEDYKALDECKSTAPTSISVRDLSKDEKKQHKKLIKAENRLRRQSKMKKAAKRGLCRSR